MTTQFGTREERIARNHSRKGKLTAFQVVLCREFMLDHNQTQAYIRAGGQGEYQGTAAGQQFKRPAVKDEVARLEAEAKDDYERRKQAVGINKDMVLAEAKRNLMVAAGYEPITVGVRDDGTFIKAYKPDIGVARLQIVDIARELGMLMGGKEQPVGNTPPSPAIGQVNFNVIFADPDARRDLEVVVRRMESLTGGNGGQVVAGTVAQS